MNEIENKEIQEMAIALIRGTGLKVTERAEFLYNAGYRQVRDKVVIDKEEYERLKTIEITLEEFTKDDVVLLSKEEYESLHKLFTYDRPMLDRIYNFIKDIKEQARKETARDILKTIKSYDGWNELQQLRNDIAEEYEVEVE